MSRTLCTIQMREIIVGRNMAKKTSFGAKLAERIRAEGLDPKSFVEKSGIKQANVYRWLRGGRPSPENAIEVAKFFNEEPAVWMRLAKYPVGDPATPDEADQEWATLRQSFPWLQNIIPAMTRLSPKNRKLVQDLIENLGDQDSGEVQ